MQPDLPFSHSWWATLYDSRVKADLRPWWRTYHLPHHHRWWSEWPDHPICFPPWPRSCTGLLHDGKTHQAPSLYFMVLRCTCPAQRFHYFLTWTDDTIEIRVSADLQDWHNFYLMSVWLLIQLSPFPCLSSSLLPSPSDDQRLVLEIWPPSWGRKINHFETPVAD